MDRTKQRATLGAALIAIAAMMANGAPAQAQQTELDALRAQIAELQGRLEKLEEKQLASADAAKAAPPTSAKFPVTASGLLQVQGLGFFNATPGVHAPDTFRLRRAELRFVGTITPRIIGQVMFDPAKAVTTTGGVVNPSTNVMQELQISYLLHKASATSTDSHFIDVGQFKIPIGYEGDLVSSSALQTVDRALMYNARDVYGGGNGDIRDTGAELRGNLSQFDYRLGIFNGLGERQNQLAAGDAKAIVARLVFHPEHFKGLQLGISGATGNNRNIPVAGSQARRSLTNLFAVYNKDKWTFQTEYLTGRAQTLAAAPGVTRSIRSYYGSAGYKFTPNIEGVARYDSFDFDKNLAAAAGTSNNVTVHDITLGVNYYLKGNNAKIQANLVRRTGGEGLVLANGFAGNATSFGQSRTAFITNFQVAF